MLIGISSLFSDFFTILCWGNTASSALCLPCS
jgi:hypothetical protein